MNCVKHGRGTLRYANGDVYEGGWRNGLEHGHGKLQIAAPSEVLSGYFALGEYRVHSQYRMGDDATTVVRGRGGGQMKAIGSQRMNVTVSGRPYDVNNFSDDDAAVSPRLMLWMKTPEKGAI